MDRRASFLLEANRSRAAVYHMLASLYFKEPTEEQIEHIREQGFSGLEDLDPLFAEGCRDISESVRRRRSSTRQLLAADYAGAILGAGFSRDCRATPFESVFTSKGGLLMQDARDDVYHRYLKDHLEVDESLHVPDDHLSFMFEYLALLAERCNESLRRGDCGQAQKSIAAQRDFHASHLLNWIDEYCDSLEECAQTRFYQGLAKMTRSFVHLDGEVLVDMQASLDEMAGVRTNACAV